MKHGWLGLVVAIGVSLAGCGGTNLEGDRSLPDPNVKFVNASPDSNALDFFLNEELEAGNVAYQQATDGWLKIPFRNEAEGAYDVLARQAGQPEDLDRIVNQFNRDSNTLVVVYGLANPGDDTDKIARLTLIQADRVPPTGNKARLIVFHGFNRAPGDSTPPLTFQSPGENPLFRLADIQYGTSQNLLVDSGEQTLEMRRADADGENIYASTTVSLGSGKIYLVLLVGIEDSGDSSRDPTIRFIEIEPKN
ncbi:MAG TPA: DUF4397 domain-containing protein [Fimbriimonadaceae bacterium]|nr:DUF4397 domain-containing protein [Fimbriimonadaceae bacterium]